MRNCMRTIGRSFRSFKNHLTVKYIIPFKDNPEMLKNHPVEYSFIEDDDWNIFVKDILSNAFQVELLKHATSINMYQIIFINCLTKMYILILIYKMQEFRKVQKERRKKHIYNHRLSRKGYARLEEDLVS